MHRFNIIELYEMWPRYIPSLQSPLKSGLKWLEEESDKQFQDSFLDISERDQKSILDAKF